MDVLKGLVNFLGVIALFSILYCGVGKLIELLDDGGAVNQAIFVVVILLAAYAFHNNLDIDSKKREAAYEARWESGFEEGFSQGEFEGIIEGRQKIIDELNLRDPYEVGWDDGYVDGYGIGWIAGICDEEYDSTPPSRNGE